VPILTDREHAALRGYIDAHPGLDDAAIFAALYAPSTRPNPAPRPAVLSTLSGPGLMGLLSPASLKSVESFPAIAELTRDIESQDRVKVTMASALLVGSGSITLAEFTAIMTALAATVPDPSWQATVPGPCWAETNLGTHGVKTWADADGSHNFIPIAAVAEARH
jgi:hypothetical protein